MINPATLTDELSEIKREWIESIDDIYDEFGEPGVREILRTLQNRTLSRGIALNEATLNTPYVNTILPAEQPAYPGDIMLEKRIENIIRWNAMAMVLKAQDQGFGVGGHIATYASAATMMEVGFNHFFRKRSAEYGGDLVLIQPHAAPGIYARAYLEGRLTEQQLGNYRRELQPGGGLCSYPHPRLMPNFWEIPNASMGLSTPAAIYQARFAKYLENRGLKPKNGGKVWCFIGDGESDEPEVLGTINIASREKLDNLILVINCNLQRLDGPVRGNGKIIQELERTFRGADWNVIKVIWGSGWDSLLAQDSNGVLRKRMEECIDGDYQRYSVLSGDVQREHWVDGDSELEKIMNLLSDEELKEIKRGGHDPRKIHAAFKYAVDSIDKPTVILVKTVKGDGMGPSAQGRNTSHQKKNLSKEERIQCAKNYDLPLTEEAIERADFYCPDEGSAEIQYLQHHRRQLGGYLPAREVICPTLTPPELATFKEAIKGSGDRVQSTTSAMVRMLAHLLRDERLGKYIVPIVPDEARTFGMDVLFKVAGIYSPEGQNYTPVDVDTLVTYREAKDGQILQEGICETGAMASFLSAGSAYAVHGLPMIPFYIFYSIFGFQRVGDMIWSCGDMMCRGFLLGATAGRTTLSGEGLQHQDGHSHILASTYPNLISYDPAFAFELAIIIREGMRRMYQQQENIFYYITLYNENYSMPPIPDDDSCHEGVLRGAYCFKRSDRSGEKIHLLASGAIMQQALAAAKLLQEMEYAVDIWSITSFNELCREADACERYNRLHPLAKQRRSFVETLFANEEGVMVAVTDYMKSLPNSIAKWMPRSYTVLGTDGYGLSESREAIRDFFEISPAHIIQAAITSLYTEQKISKTQLEHQLNQLTIDSDKPDPVRR